MVAGVKASAGADGLQTHVEVLVLPGGPKRLPLVDLSPEDRQRAEADEVLFSLDDRLGERYASYVGAVTQDLLQGGSHLYCGALPSQLVAAGECLLSHPGCLLRVGHRRCCASDPAPFPAVPGLCC